MISSAILGEAGVQYDIDKFFYLGSPYSTYHAVFLSRKQAGFSSIEKLQAATGVRIGAQSVGFVTYNEGRLFAYLLGLKEPRFVAAYSGAELDPCTDSRRDRRARHLAQTQFFNATRSGSKKVRRWTSMRSSKFPGATSIRNSLRCGRSRASPNRT
jgi:hypothetical protein